MYAHCIHVRADRFANGKPKLHCFLTALSKRMRDDAKIKYN